MNHKHIWRAPLVLAAVLAAGCGSPSPAELLEQAREAVAAGEPRTADIHLRNLLLEEPENAAARRLLGEVQLALGNPGAAATQLERAVELGVDPAAVQLARVRALVGQGEHEAALEQLETGPELTGDERVPGLRLEAAAHRALGNAEPAEAAYRAALAIEPGSAAVRTELAELAAAAGRTDEARELVEGVLASNPEFTPALLLRGNLEMRAGATEQAEGTYRDVLRLAGSGTENYTAALARLTELLLARSATAQAAERADELLELAPQNPIARTLKARVEHTQGQTDAAERRLEGVVADFPDFAPANQLLGAINVEQQQFGQAEMYLQTAMQNASDDRAARLLLVQTYLRQGEIGPARELLGEAFPAAESDAVMYALAGRASRAAGETDLALEYFEQSEQAVPETPEQLFGLASIYVAAGEHERAVRVLEAAEQVDVESATTQDFLLALAHLAEGEADAADTAAARLVERLPEAAWPLTLRGTIALRTGALGAAREHYTAALDIAPEHVPTLFNLARVHTALGEPERAAERLERIVEIDPEQGTAKLALAELALRRQDFETAREWLEQAPDAPERLQLEARLAMAEGRTEAGAEMFGRLFERAPSAENALLAFAAARRASVAEPEAVLERWLDDNPGEPRVTFALGQLALERGNTQAAVERFETVVESAPSHAGALNNLAWIYQEQGDDRALATAERAYEAAPQNPAVADTLGWLHLQNGDPETGLEFLAQAARANPEHAEIQYHHAVALHETGQSESAVAAFETLLEQNAQFPGRDDAERRLAELRDR